MIATDLRPIPVIPRLALQLAAVVLLTVLPSGMRIVELVARFTC
ncbi:hypothetical protein ABIE49_001708 [Bradyrhizobium sp. OAE829]